MAMFTSTKQLVNRLSSKPECMVSIILKASICHKSALPPQKVYHWPYETRSWNFTNFYLDPFTKKKWNENTKIIQIEGNVGAGKEEFAKRLADELGMKYLPKVNLDEYYINDHGYDYRALNPLLPERMRICDFEMWHENPSRHSVIHMQYHLFKLRLLQYIKAIQHLFNTGQGVVMVRSVFSDRVFVEAMHNVGWLPTGYLRGDGVRFYDYKARYNFIRNLLLADMPKPHLTIYLDSPVETCLERIRKSNDPAVVNSKALVPEFLEAMQGAYEDIMLQKLGTNGHLLRYSHEKRMDDAELRDVVDDIEELDFEYDFHDTRFEDWESEAYLWHFTQRRYWTTELCTNYIKWLDQPWFDTAGLGDSITQGDIKLREALYEGHVGPYGWFNSLETDLKQNNPLKVFLNRVDFGKRLSQHFRSDFL